jgi:hypothetical protein
MIGDLPWSRPLVVAGPLELDRLLVIANDLDSPSPLPGGQDALTITEAGPVGIYGTSLASVQQLQSLLRTGAPLPGVALVGTIDAPATLATSVNRDAIDALLSASPEAYDVVPLAAPSSDYDAAVAASFADRQPLIGESRYDGSASGALLQSGADALTAGADWDAFYYYQYVVPLEALTVGGWGPAGRLKVSSGNSPLPRDRAYFRYDAFAARPLAGADGTLQRFTPGLERTFLAGLASLEVRLPLVADGAQGLSADASTTALQGDEFGNVALFWKGLLLATDAWAWSAGMGLGLPTAGDAEARLADGTVVVGVENQAVYLKPFLAGLYARDGWFAHGFCEIDVDASGNRVTLAPAGPWSASGRVHDSVYAFADFGAGYRYALRGGGLLTAIAPTCEVHYNAALDRGDGLSSGALRVEHVRSDLHAVNMTLGATFELGTRSAASVGYVVPAGDADSRNFDGGMRVHLEYRP